MGTAASPRLRLARLGEETAARYLEEQGLHVIERNTRFRQGEIDLVAQDGPTTVFVEVKTRRTDSHGTPQEAVDRRKQARLRLVASIWLARVGRSDTPCRFDVVAIRLRDDRPGPPEIVHLRNAF